MFVSEPFYRLAVDLYWISPVPFDITKQGDPGSPSLKLTFSHLKRCHFEGKIKFKAYFSGALAVSLRECKYITVFFRAAKFVEFNNFMTFNDETVV